MNRLSTTKRKAVVAALVEGNSISATCRITHHHDPQRSCPCRVVPQGSAALVSHAHSPAIGSDLGLGPSNLLGIGELHRRGESLPLFPRCASLALSSFRWRVVQGYVHHHAGSQRDVIRRVLPELECARLVFACRSGPYSLTGTAKS